MRTKIVVGLAAAATLLAGCGGTGSESTDPPAVEPAPASSAASAPVSSAAPSSAAPSSAAPSSAAPSASTSTSAKLADPCKVIPASKTKELIGYTFARVKAGTVAGSKLCSYVGGSTESTSLIAQEVLLTGTFERYAATAEAQLPDAKSSDTEVDGADKAKVVTTTLSGSPTVAILASANGVFYQVIIGGPKLDRKDGQKAATTYAAALIKG